MRNSKITLKHHRRGKAFRQNLESYRHQIARLSLNYRECSAELGIVSTSSDLFCFNGMIAYKTFLLPHMQLKKKKQLGLSNPNH